MPTPEPTSTRNLDRYGVPAIDWARVRQELEAQEPQDPGRPTHWLTTTNLVVEGTAERVLDPAELRTVAEAYAAHGWPASATDEGVTAEYSAPSAGPPPWYVYRVVPSTVYALGTAEPYGATRFDLT
jgi:hypothetical protein